LVVLEDRLTFAALSDMVGDIFHFVGLKFVVVVGSHQEPNLVT
jgi:hypothetical protein